MLQEVNEDNIFEYSLRESALGKFHRTIFVGLCVFEDTQIYFSLQSHQPATLRKELLKQRSDIVLSIIWTEIIYF